MVKNLKCISRLNIYYYPNLRYKSCITSLKAVIAGKSLISARLDIDRILHFVFYGKILQIYRQHWVRKFYRHILSKYRQIPKKWVGGGVVTLPHIHTPAWHTLFIIFIKFQEINNKAVSRDYQISVLKSGRRSLPESRQSINCTSPTVFYVWTKNATSHVFPFSESTCEQLTNLFRFIFDLLVANSTI